MDTSQLGLTADELNKLQRLRASVLAFQNKIAALPAKEASNPLNEQFNQLRLEAKTLLKDRGFDKKVSRAVTEDLVTDRFQKIVMPRLFGIITIGVILVLLGLGVNSIILEDLIVNTLGCLVSSAGLLLVIGAFAVYLVNQSRERLTTYGDLYQYCDALLYQVDHTLAVSIPNWTARSEADKLPPPIPSMSALTLDSLRGQAKYWEHTLDTLEAQRAALGMDVLPDLTTTIDFVRDELEKAQQQIVSLQREQTPLLVAGEQEAPPLLVEEATLPSLEESSIEDQPFIEEGPTEVASAHTLGMPAVRANEPNIQLDAMDDALDVTEADETEVVEMAASNEELSDEVVSTDSKS